MKSGLSSIVSPFFGESVLSKKFGTWLRQARYARLPPELVYRPKILVFWNKTMKFTGLILICASSCLALILPAIGVVQFPKIAEHMPSSAVSGPPQAAFATPGSNAPGWAAARPTSMQSDVLPGASFSSPFPPSLQQAVPPLLQESDGKSSTYKFGMGAWLLLGPLCLIGLALWTFSPNPSIGKPSK